MEATIQNNIPAKLNLSLSITGQRGNLHTIKSVMTSVNIYDTVIAKPNNGKSIRLSLKSDNEDFIESLFRQNIMSAIDKFVSRYGAVDADLEVFNRIKLGAGIGGSTSSVIGVLKSLAKIKNVELEDEFLLSVGSDAPFMFRGGTCLVSGVGECVMQLEFKKLYFVVLLPSRGVDSGQAYNLYDELKAKGIENDAKKETVRYADNISLPYECNFKNDLELSAEKLNEEIASAKKSLYEAGAKTVLMSGSGSAVFAVFEDEDSANSVLKKVKFKGNNLLLESVES